MLYLNSRFWIKSAYFPQQMAAIPFDSKRHPLQFWTLQPPKKTELCYLEYSDYVTIVITVPETHANAVREAMGKAGAGKVGNYSYCSYSVKGVGRFMPNKGSDPYIGQEGIIEEVVEERIETVCNRFILEHVLEEIKKAHPYEETVIDIYPVYEIGRKKAKGAHS